MRKSCFLFGHADAPQSILPILEQAIENEIDNGISVFFVGYHGNFDRMAASALRSVKHRHAEISLMLVLAYHPAEQAIEAPKGFDGTYYPPLEGIPRRYAIVRANQHMVKTSDSLICYVRHHGNTRNLLDLAVRQKRALQINNLADTSRNLSKYNDVL